MCVNYLPDGKRRFKWMGEKINLESDSYSLPVKCKMHEPYIIEWKLLFLFPCIFSMYKPCAILHYHLVRVAKARPMQRLLDQLCTWTMKP